MCAYLRDATFITGLAAVSDSVLVVTHGRYLGAGADRGGTLNGPCDEPWSLAKLTDRSEYANVFVHGVNVVRDTRAPGEILGYASGRVVVVRPGGGGGDSSYTLVEYKVASQPQRGPGAQAPASPNAYAAYRSSLVPNHR